MTQAAIALKDKDGNVFNQEAATNAAGNKITVFTPWLWNSGTPIAIDGSNPLPVSLITGFSTASNQTANNTSVASIDGKTPALGQALAAGSTPVVLTTLQLTALTPLTTVGLNAGSATIGTVNLGTLNGVATAAKQPALGVAGTASTDVITVQGITNGTPIFTQTVASTSTTTSTNTQTFINVTTAGTAVALAGSSTLVQRFTVVGQKAEQTANTGIVRIGFTSGLQPLTLAATTVDQANVLSFDAPTGKKFDLSTIYVNAAVNGDGVLVLGFN